MTKGMKIALAVAIVVLLGGIAAVIVVFTGSGSTDLTVDQQTNTTVEQPRVVNNNTNNTPPTTTDEPELLEETVEVDHSAAVLRLARSVVARYGSFSNQNNFENITSLEPFMTSDFQSRSAQYISENQANEAPEDYYGISTEVISLELVSLEEKTATVEVLAQRIEEEAGKDSNPFTQSAVVTFEQQNGDWLVDSISWK